MKALIWKEWREVRLFVFLAVAIIIASRLFLDALPVHKADKNDLMVATGTFFLPLLFALFLGVVPFTNEFSKKTQSFLLSNAVSAAKIFWTKFLFGLFLLLCLVLLCRTVLYIRSSFSATYFGAYLAFFCVAFPYILIYSAAFFTSLLIHTALTAILCTPFILIFGILLTCPLLASLVLTPLLDGFPEDLFLFSIWIPVALFIIFGFLVWRNAVSKGMNQTRILVSSTIVALLVSFGTHAAFNLSAGRGLTRAIQQAKVSGIKLTFEEIIPPPIPEEENAASVYQEAFILVKKLREKYAEEWKYMSYVSYWRNYQFESLPGEKKKTVRQLILKAPDFIRLYSLVDKAANLPACRFNLNYEDGVAMRVRHLWRMRELAKLVAARTYIHAEGKSYAEALKSAKVGLQLGNSLNDEPIISSQLTRIAVDAIAIESLRPILNISPSEISIKDYEELISEVDNKERKLTKGLEGELAFRSTYIFGRILQGEWEESEFWFRRRRRTILLENLYWTYYMRFYASYMGKPIQKHDYGFYVRFLTEATLLSRLPYYKAHGNLVRLEKEIRKLPRRSMTYPLSTDLLPYMLAAQEHQTEYYALPGGLRIALALKIYKAKAGEYPNELGFLVTDIIRELPLDPFTGRNYIYRKEGKGFIVYSVGKNLKDDTGISGMYDKRRGVLKDDIAWRCEE